MSCTSVASCPRRTKAGAGLRPKQGPEAGLNEMVIRGERLLEPALFHDDDRDAIDQRPVLVAAFAEQSDAFPEKRCACGNNRRRAVALQPLKQFQVNQTIRSARQSAAQFNKHVFGKEGAAKQAL